MIGIYKITSPSKKIYIGQSRNIKKRWKEHRLTTKKHKSALVNSFLKYGVENHIFEVIEECLIESLNERERYWQEFYNVIDSKKGLNCLLVKTNTKNSIISIETRNKISKAGKGRKFTEEHKNKISIANKGKVYSEETKNKMRLSKLGVKQTKEAIENASFPKRKILLNTETGIYYFGTKEACFAHNLNINTLSSYLNKRAKNKTNIIRV